MLYFFIVVQLSILRLYRAAEVMSNSIYLRLSPFEDSVDVPVYRKYRLLRTLFFKKYKKNLQNLVKYLTNTLGSIQGQVVRLLKCLSLNEREFEKQRCQAEHKAMQICSTWGIKYGMLVCTYTLHVRMYMYVCILT